MPAEALELKNRRRIYDLLSSNPGLHFRELQRQLNMPIGMLDYHLKYLEKNGVIVSRPNTYYTRYYPYERELGEDEKSILSFLRQEIPRGIIIYLLQNPRAKHREILSSFNVSGATLSYHLKRMAEKGIVKQLRLGRESEFSLKDETKTMNLIIRYRRSFLDRIVDTFTRNWLERL
jgi:predicted transcriptional regulator